jgi:hypothetical protein
LTYTGGSSGDGESLKLSIKLPPRLAVVPVESLKATTLSPFQTTTVVKVAPDGLRGHGFIIVDVIEPPPYGVFSIGE